MKKFLGILGTITIAGGGMSGIIANKPFSSQIENNNLENLKRDKRCGQNKGYVKNVEGIDYQWGATHYKTLLFIKIKKESWATIYDKYDNLSSKKFNEYLKNFVSMMHRDDRVNGNDYNNKIENINNCYNSLPSNVGLDIVMRSSGEFNYVTRQ
ncbi:hypothetical protein [Spiroplasma endosymbiont of Tipula paludosa]|uniref:hypothetical protein n=1 Tax=Spiroplasma endosymbiont of Tipula paludosa TaxID=3066295 RepID=UPI0035C8D22E